MKVLDHTKLDISFAEFGALLAVRTMLEKGYVRHTTKVDAKNKEHLFNLGVACTANGKCGTVGCIGGTMGLVMGMDAQGADHYVMRHDDTESKDADSGLEGLFYPKVPYTKVEAALSGELFTSVPLDYSKATSKMAIEAIDRFLAGKKPWSKEALDKMRG